ncbi:MAG TPA: DUF1320 domain-containing protein [Chitinispirillaceae bacterium]|nr:DUF1320 domain-containing protein [Chitinispirillaceae bacterium]
MYCTLDDLKRLQQETVLLSLADDDESGEFIIDPPNTAYTNVLEAIRDADSIIDSYLGGRYTVPIAEPIPDVIRQMSKNLALVTLYERRRELDIPEGIAERRKRHIQHLKDIQAEKAGIPELEGKKKSPSIVAVNKKDADRVFPDSLLNQY